MRSASGKLNRAIVMLGAMALGGALIFAWIFFAREQQESSRSNFHNSVQEAVTNPVQFAKERITGGIGTALGMDTSNGLPIIMMVAHGSPAENAGLQKGDFLIQINGTPTKAKPLPQIVEEVRGFTAGSVNLLIQRAGTNLQITVSRTSWNTLKKLNFN